MFLRIAFGHQARTGKDTCCNYLQEKYGGNILHFSDPLYNILYHAQGVCGFKRQKDTKFLQWIGTNWARDINENVWCNVLLSKVKNSKTNCFVGDVRFKNELQCLKDKGFTCIKIVRKDRPIDRDPNHPSETELQTSSNWDYIIYNDGTLEELYLNLESVINDIIKK